MVRISFITSISPLESPVPSRLEGIGFVVVALGEEADCLSLTELISNFMTILLSLFKILEMVVGFQWRKLGITNQQQRDSMKRRCF